VDIAEHALEVARRRLGPRAATVTWLVGDITAMDLPADTYDVWHDRAVFHFLTGEADRRAYIERVCCSVRDGGFIVMATFGPEGPEKCSGLPVVRYSWEQLHAAFGETFRVVDHREERHVTPKGSEQEFIYCLCVKRKC
jgi:SAM-dependent methyltransferase